MQKFSHTENRQSLTKCKQKKIKLTKTKILIKNEQVKYANGKGKQNKRIENIFTLQMQKKKNKICNKGHNETAKHREGVIGIDPRAQTAAAGSAVERVY